ncbi:MAG: hypothetical protein HY078_12255 [Elusimicrobia bacterium]|nr:hypothetical protein [Elusimicrobiota bacterium]
MNNPLAAVLVAAALAPLAHAQRASIELTPPALVPSAASLSGLGAATMSGGSLGLQGLGLQTPASVSPSPALAAATLGSASISPLVESRGLKLETAGLAAEPSLGARSILGGLRRSARAVKDDDARTLDRLYSDPAQPRSLEIRVGPPTSLPGRRYSPPIDEPPARASGGSETITIEDNTKTPTEIRTVRRDQLEPSTSFSAEGRLNESERAALESRLTNRAITMARERFERDGRIRERVRNVHLSPTPFYYDAETGQLDAWTGRVRVSGKGGLWMEYEYRYDTLSGGLTLGSVSSSDGR